MHHKISCTYLFLLLQDGELILETSVYYIQSDIGTFLISNTFLLFILNCGFYDCYFMSGEWF